MESPEKIAAFTQAVQESIKRTMECGCSEELFDLWSNSINHSEKMKDLWTNVDMMFKDYRAKNMILENPLPEVQITCDLRYMLAKREENLSKSGFVIREGFQYALSSLLAVHPELNLQKVLDELKLLESNQDNEDHGGEFIVGHADEQDLGNTKCTASQLENECQQVKPDSLCNLTAQELQHNNDSSSSKNLESRNQSRVHSSKRSKKHLSKRSSYDKFHSEKYAYSSFSKYDDKYYDSKDYLHRSSKSSRSSHRESRKSKRRKSYSRSRSRSPSKRKSYRTDRSRQKSDKEKKREKLLRHLSSEYHSEYDDLYKSYQHKVDNISNMERKDFYLSKNHNNKLLPSEKSLHELNFIGLPETAIQELKDSQKILQTIHKKLS